MGIPHQTLTIQLKTSRFVRRTRWQSEGRFTNFASFWSYPTANLFLDWINVDIIMFDLFVFNHDTSAKFSKLDAGIWHDRLWAMSNAYSGEYSGDVKWIENRRTSRLKGDGEIRNTMLVRTEISTWGPIDGFLYREHPISFIRKMYLYFYVTLSALLFFWGVLSSKKEKPLFQA